jgi:hypothetical protein
LKDVQDFILVTMLPELPAHNQQGKTIAEVSQNTRKTLVPDQNMSRNAQHRHTLQLFTYRPRSLETHSNNGCLNAL